MVGPSGLPPRAQSGVKSTWVVPKILWWVTRFNESNLLSMYVVTPILEGLRPPQNFQNRRICVLYAKTPKSEVLRSFKNFKNINNI